VRAWLATFLVVIGVAAMSQELRFSGVIGQSQAVDAEPCAALHFHGVAVDGSGRLWAASGGNHLLVFVKAAAGDWRVDGELSLPVATAGCAALWFNGKNIVAWLADNRVALVDAEARKVTATVTLPEKTSSVFVTSSPGRFDLFALSGRAVFGVTFSSAAAERLLTLPDLREVPYTSLGLEPSSGDILAGTPYPFQKIYRFSADGAQVVKDGWPRQGWPVQFLAVQGAACFVNRPGVVTELPAARKEFVTIQPDFATSCQGAARVGDGAWWLATSQGLLHVRADGVVDTRLGGVADVRCLTVSRGGEVMAMVENGQRSVRFLIDGEPCSVPQSCGNEPWRVGAGWKDRAVSIVPDISGYLVLDDVERRLWRFDPAKTAWGDTPWTPLNALASPTSIAVGDLLLWLVDDGALLEADRRSLSFKKVDVEYPPGFVPRFVAACGGTQVFLASGTRVLALERTSDGVHKLRWSSPALFKRVAGIATDGHRVVVADAAELVVLSAADGAERERITAAGAPGGRFTPTSLAFFPPWLVVADQAGKRLLRFHVK